jgi:DNA-binding LacI/PurR family transcriptional regulator
MDDSQPGLRRRPVVMADVAARVGVSVMTVSRVLNGHSSVKPQTRRMVLAAMEELGYRPNVAARALVTGRSRTLGVVSLDTNLYGPATTLFCIEQAAREEGYFVSICSVSRMRQESIRSALDHLRGQDVAGIIIIAPHVSAPEALQDLPEGVPVVVVQGLSDVGVPVVAVDQTEGARLAVEHLLSLGHETVWHIGGPGDWLEARARVRGWQQTLASAGKKEPPLLTGDWSARSGYEHGRRLASVAGVTAVFVANDNMALGLLRALGEAGLDVPGDVSVVGFDDVPESAYYAPPLTTVHQDFDAIGHRSLAVLMEQMASDVLTDGRELVTPQLIVRESTSSPPRPGR